VEEFDIVPVNATNKPDLRKIGINVALIILLALASFGIGKYSSYKGNKVPVTIREVSGTVVSTNKEVVVTNEALPQATPQAKVEGVSTVSGETVVASKNSTKYHYPWCAGAKQISAVNKITFNSIEEARKAGYTPAANCKGLK
jgi:hypothetical protein